jgi:hypothetical protein
MSVVNQLLVDKMLAIKHLLNVNIVGIPNEYHS